MTLPKILPRIESLIPALPGTFRLLFEDGKVFKIPVLAWGVTANGVAYPITLSPFGIEENASAESWMPAYLFPDGTVQGRLGAFTNFDAWLDQQKKGGA